MKITSFSNNDRVAERLEDPLITIKILYDDSCGCKHATKEKEGPGVASGGIRDHPGQSGGSEGSDG